MIKKWKDYVLEKKFAQIKHTNCEVMGALKTKHDNLINEYETKLKLKSLKIMIYSFEKQHYEAKNTAFNRLVLNTTQK